MKKQIIVKKDSIQIDGIEYATPLLDAFRNLGHEDLKKAKEAFPKGWDCTYNATAKVRSITFDTPATRKQRMVQDSEFENAESVTITF